MQEKKRNTARVTATGPGDDLFGDLAGMPAAPGVATVIHGTYAETLPVAQMSVAQVRSRFADLLDIHPEATAIIDGEPAEDDTVVQAGQNLMFVRRAGEKGAVRSRSHGSPGGMRGSAPGPEGGPPCPS